MADADGQSRTFRATPEDISAADAWIEEVGRHWGIAERTTFRARICVAEIATNVLEHGTSATEPAEFDVTLRRHGDGLDLEITDSGRPFNVTTAPAAELPQSIETARIGGLGLHLVRSYAEDISYHHDGGRNRLKLHLPAAFS
jgi:anti-sigma regulatory factor (Ser/Thr protein kinase)